MPASKCNLILRGESGLYHPVLVYTIYNAKRPYYKAVYGYYTKRPYYFGCNRRNDSLLHLSLPPGFPDRHKSVIAPHENMYACYASAGHTVLVFMTKNL